MSLHTNAAVPTEADHQDDQGSSVDQKESVETNSSTSQDIPDMENARLKFESPSQVARSKSVLPAIKVEKCGACEKTVYAMEKVEANKQVYHRACLRCSQCRTVLTPKNFSNNSGVIFCTTHYKQNFKTKGNYDEGFGREQHKKQWNSKASEAGGSDQADVRS